MAPRAAIEWVSGATGQRSTLRPAALRWSSDDLWRGIHLERRLDVPGELPEGYLLRHVISLHLRPFPLELYWPGRGWQAQRLTTESIQIFPARVPYAARWDRGGEFVLLEIAPDFLSACKGSPPEHLRLRPFFTTNDCFVTHAIRALEDDLRAGSPAGRLYGESLGLAVAAHLVRKYSDVVLGLEKRMALPSATLRLVLQYIGDNLETNPSLQDLADLVQMNVYRFVRSFKLSTGVPPHQYILRERIERAKSLLCNPALPLTEVAMRCGFADQSHLSNIFRRVTKLSPRAYRRAVA